MKNKLPAPMVNAGGEDMEPTLEHVRTVGVGPNGRMIEEYRYRDGFGVQMLRIDERNLEKHAKRLKVKPHKVKERQHATKEQRYARDPNEKFRC